jgi:hypothetical protein
MTSEDEGFLARWSRRKREAETTTPASPSSAEPATSPEVSDHPRQPESHDVSDIIAQLPRIEEITAATDIRAFLAPGVPNELRLAALRRVWSADPAIRDFIGLAENQWDFNAPDGVPGFGSLLDPDQVRRLLAKVVGGEEKQAGTSVSEPAEPDPPETERAATLDALTPVSANEPGAPGIDVAASVSPPDEAPPPPRRHGGALPR